jgi:hypothetical protein
VKRGEAQAADKDTLVSSLQKLESSRIEKYASALRFSPALLAHLLEQPARANFIISLTLSSRAPLSKTFTVFSFHRTRCPDSVFVAAFPHNAVYSVMGKSGNKIAGPGGRRLLAESRGSASDS